MTAPLPTAPLLTDRLDLRPARLADVPALFTFLGNPAAMRLTQCDANLAACRRRVAVHEWARRRDGFAPWVVRLRTTGAIIGWGGLYIDPFDPGWGPEIGYHLAPEHHRQGYGRELARISCATADHVHQLPELHAFAHPDNHASRAILARQGFLPVRDVPHMNRTLFRRIRHSQTT